VSPGDASWPSIVELFDMWLDATCDRARLIHALRAPVGIRLRERFLQRSAPR
jgi:hypothetical protein